jgi:hypothetical protein
MNHDVAAGEAGSRVLADVARRALRGFGHRQCVAAILLGAVVSIVNAASFMAPLLAYAARASPVLLLAGFFAEDQMRAFVLVAAIVIADRAVDERWPWRRAYVVAALAGCVGGVAVAASFDAIWRTWVLPDAWPAERLWQHGRAAYLFYPLFDLTHWLLIGSAVVFLHADRRAARATAARLRDAERDRIRRGRLALESRLQAMQARVEPRFLFNTLSQVERLNAIEPARAANMLQHLIAYLRAAMPRMRDSSSTVAHEIALVRAYLDIAGLGPDGRIVATIDVAADARDSRMPPMLLLPLIDHVGLRSRGSQAAPTAIGITARAMNGRLRIDVIAHPARPAADSHDPDAAAMRERLAALHGASATLVLTCVDGSTLQARLELPLEAREDSGG